MKKHVLLALVLACSPLVFGISVHVSPCIPHVYSAPHVYMAPHISAPHVYVSPHVPMTSRVYTSPIQRPSPRLSEPSYPRLYVMPQPRDNSNSEADRRVISVILLIVVGAACLAGLVYTFYMFWDMYNDRIKEWWKKRR